MTSGEALAIIVLPSAHPSLQVQECPLEGVTPRWPGKLCHSTVLSRQTSSTLDFTLSISKCWWGKGSKRERRGKNPNQIKPKEQKKIQIFQGIGGCLFLQLSILKTHGKKPDVTQAHNFPLSRTQWQGFVYRFKNKYNTEVQVRDQEDLWHSSLIHIQSLGIKSEKAPDFLPLISRVMPNGICSSGWEFLTFPNNEK